MSMSRKSLKIPSISSDVELCLSMIESGCLFTSIGDEATLIIKGGREEVDSFRELHRIEVGFAFIDRPEFPSLKIQTLIYNGNEKPFGFDYFFNVESKEETALIRQLIRQGYFNVLFYVSEIEYLKRARITHEGKMRLRSLLAEAR